MAQEGLARLLAAFETGVSYQPLQDEAALPHTFANGLPPVYAVPAQADADPEAIARDAREAVRGRHACVLVPGQRFDRYGTRHGRGGGWYDRFLASIPPDWVRIGCATPAQLSDAPLARAAWDEPVDWVCVVDAGAVIALHETSARRSHLLR